MSGRKTFVSILVGAMLVGGSLGAATLSWGGSIGHVPPDTGPNTKPNTETFNVTGILLEKAKDSVMVKAQDKKDSGRYRFGEDMAEDVATIVAGNLVKLTWQGRRKLVTIEAIVPAEMEGEVVGKVVAKAREWIDVKAATGPTERYVPRRVDGEPDKAVLDEIEKRSVGDTVKIKWTYDRRKQIVEIALNGAATEKPADKDKEKPKGDEPKK